MKTIFGCKSVEAAEPEKDGSMPSEQDFEKLCKTYRDSVEITEDDPDVENEYSDQDTEPIASFAEAGETTGSFQAFEFDNDTLQKLYPDATVVDEEFTFGKNIGFETAIRFKTDSGHIIAYPKVKFFAKKNIQLVKKGLALIDCQFTPLSQATISKAE